MKAMELSGKVALVTGASRGLGAAIANELGVRGAKVAVNYLRSSDKAANVVAKIQEQGGTAKAFQADVSDEEAIHALNAGIESEWGPVEILVINATAPQPFIPLEELTWRHCLDQLEYFVKSPVLLAKAVVGNMKARKQGRIIHIGSEVFEKGVPKFSNYVSAKGAQLGLCRSWANELAPWEITVNLVAPGWIPTERHINDPQEDKDAYAAAVPMKRMGDPEDVAHAVAYLASDAAKFVSGQKISVNGANTLH